MGKQNIGTINALVRITLGLFLISYGTVKATKRPWHQRYYLLILAAAMKVAEGIVRYCPVTDMVKKQINANLPFNLFSDPTNIEGESSAEDYSSVENQSSQSTDRPVTD
ncbi:YgaP family membrane protein [Alkalibacillus almallahensis]|uniref:YgaP family membrane protein n=1 Tax=Alkalibacillus almallahensis TaxID=1379154 RepID=UPI0014213081|nr:DUF2892 domain-containing protein [Alkalibacillus almallahensis]NIK11701.1 hypothetical protein [Alkalibacillus almallahensis]